MTEKSKTVVFLGVALASTALAFATRPGSVRVDAINDVGESLFSEFTDPAQAKSLKIVRFDESLASLSQIESKETDGLWTLPSHEGYPADAENRVRDATTPFVDLRSLAVASDLDGDHAIYGVLEPNADKSAVGDQGVGTLVTVKGDGGKTLVDLVIGKEVKDAEGQRYVRRPGQSRVYIAKVDPDALPVRFEDWIEKDLLKLNAFDVEQVVLKDYSFQVANTLRGPVTDYDQRHQITATDDNGTWKLDEMLIAQGDDLVMSELAEDEQLNQEAFRELKDALDGLEIVSVQRKPASLGDDLRADKGFANDQAGIDSLIERGFYPVTMPGGDLEILSADGEVQINTKDGVEYTLRFGGVEGVDTDSEEGALNRYLLVSARVNEDTFPMPELEDVPQTVDELKAARAAVAAELDSPTTTESVDSASPVEQVQGTQESVDGSDGADGGETDADIADDPDSAAAAEEDAADGSAGEAEEAAEAAGDDETVEGTVGEESEAADSDQSSIDDGSATETFFVQANESTATESESDGTAAADVEASSDSADENSAGSAVEEADAATAEPGSDETDWDAELKTEQERVTRENQRKLDERNDKIKKAQQKVQELNYRFADWYYVISEAVYQKIHLGREDVVEAKEAEAAEESTP